MSRQRNLSRAGTSRRRAALLLALAVCGACGGKKGDAGKKPNADLEAKKPALEHGLSSEQQKQVLAKVGDTVITLGDFANRLATQSPYLRARYASPEKRREFLDNMVRFELLALEAKKRGDTEQPEVERVRREMMVQQMMKDLFDDKGVKLSDITDAEIKTYYDQHKDDFHKPPQRRASMILYKDKKQAEAALKKLQAAGDDIEPFKKLAHADSIDADSKSRDGDLRFFSREPEPGEVGPPKAVREAAFALEKVGQLSPKVIETENGFALLKLTGDRPALDRSLEDVRRLIQNRLWREKREAAIEQFVNDLRQKANVKENLDLLAQVKVDTSDAPKHVEDDGEADDGAARGHHDKAKDHKPGQAPK